MLFKSLAAPVRSHSTLLADEGLIIPRQDAVVLVEQLKFKVEVYKVCNCCIRVNYYGVYSVM